MNLPSIAALAGKHGIKPLKKYGQNFIFDESLCDKIVKYSQISSTSYALEIGPGPAGLTRSILKAGPEELDVVETDERCLPLLEEIKETYSNLNIHHKDALKLELKDINANVQLDIISNLPYNIGTPLVLRWLKQVEHVNSMTLMLQKEVVDRIIAKPNNKNYGRLSIICQAICNVEKCFDVSPNAFYPKPKIWSSIVRMTPKSIQPDNKIINELEQITHAAFIARRKMIKSSLKNLHQNIDEILASLNLDPAMRAENLSVNQYISLAKILMQN